MSLWVLFLGLLFGASTYQVMDKQATKSAGRPVADNRNSEAVKFVSNFPHFDEFSCFCGPPLPGPKPNPEGSESARESNVL